MKKLLLLILLTITVKINYSQDNLLVRTLIRNTEISIYKAQKEIIASQSHTMLFQLSAAITQQVNAIEEFGNQNYSIAAFYSIKARQYSNKVLADIQIKGLDAYLLNAEETAIQKSKEYQKWESSSEPRMSNDLIENSILLDPDKLSKNFKISLL